MKKLTSALLIILSIIVASSTRTQAQTMVSSKNGVDFLYDVYDATGGGYKVKLIIVNNTEKILTTSGDFRLEFKGGGWIKMGPSTIKAYGTKQYVWDGKYSKYPEVARWNTPAFRFK